ncbi:hypothetical protein Pmar_PMAR025490, partial [Perkinsus marinus ATCC 50983]
MIEPSDTADLVEYSFGQLYAEVQCIRIALRAWTEADTRYDKASDVDASLEYWDPSAEHSDQPGAWVVAYLFRGVRSHSIFRNGVLQSPIPPWTAPLGLPYFNSTVTVECWTGWPCTLDMSESSPTMLHDGDNLIAVETTEVCETLYGGGLWGVPGGGISRGALNGMFAFGDVASDRATEARLSQSPGVYKLCWCDGRASDCSSIKDFRIEAGRFAILGPQRTHEFYAAIGRALCIPSVQGYGLQHGDFLAVMSTCGMVQGIRGIGSMRAQWQGVSEPTVDGRAFCWDSSSVVAAVPGVYNLCWCSARMSCMEKGPQQFRALAGKLRVHGPYPDHDFGAVIRGRVLSLGGLTGVGLSHEDRLAIMSECGVESTVGGIPTGADSNSSVVGASSISSDGGGTSYTWGLEPVTATPGAYSVCWCGGTNTTGLRNCSSARHFTALAGTIEIVGPDPSQNRRLSVVRGTKAIISRVWGRGLNISDVFAVRRSGESCSSLPSSGVPWETGIGRRGLSEPVNSDTLDSTEAFVTIVFSGRVYSQPGHYQLCWCRPVSGVSCDRDRPQDFRALAGTITVVGAESGQIFVCARGETPCSIANFKGTQSTPYDRMLLVPSRETCGTSRTVSSQLTGKATDNGKGFTWATGAGFMASAG